MIRRVEDHLIMPLERSIEELAILWLEPIEENAVAHSSGIARLSQLKGHKPPVGRNYRVRRFATLKVIEVSQPGEVLSCSVELQFPDVDIPRAALASELLALTVRLDRGVETVRENPFHFVISSRRLGQVRDLTCLEINPHPIAEARPSGS